MGTRLRLVLFLVLGVIEHAVNHVINPKYDTIIVGMGASGTTAASTLAKAGKRVLALEAQDRVGGRVHTVPFGDGIVEVGAEWIPGTVNSRTYETAINNSIVILPQDFDIKVYKSDGTLGDTELMNDLMSFCINITEIPPEKPEPLGLYITRKYYIHAWATNLSIAATAHVELPTLITIVERLIPNSLDGRCNDKSQPKQKTYCYLFHIKYVSMETVVAVLHNSNGDTMFSLITKPFREYVSEKYPNLLNDTEYIEEFLDIADIVTDTDAGSSNWNDVSTNSNYKLLVGNQQMSWHRYGYKTFFELLLNTYNNGPGLPTLDIKLNKEVTLIKWPQNTTGSVEVTCKDGDVYTADNVIVTVSLGVLKERYQTLFSPPLPESKDTAINKISMGVVGKIIFSFAEPWWAEKDSFVFQWMQSDKEKYDKWQVKFKDLSGPKGSSNTLTFWTIGETTKLYVSMETVVAVLHNSNGDTMFSLITKPFREYVSEKYPNLLNDTEYIEEFLDIADIVTDTDAGSSNWNDVSTNSNYKLLVGNQQMSWHRYGYKTFFELLLNTYNNGPGLPTLDIKLNKEVTLIKWPQNTTGSVEVTCKDGDVYTADNVIVTVSLGVLKESYQTLFSPPLPESKDTAINKISMGVVGKIIFSFAEPWWAEKDSFVFQWMQSDKEKYDKWQVKFKDLSGPKGSSNTLTFWTIGETTKLVETLPEEEVKRKCMEVLRLFLGKNMTIPDPTGMIRSTWYSNPFTRGTYSFDNLLVVEYPEARAALGAPLIDLAETTRVLFAGEATDLTHFSTVHGASDSGYREALRILTTSKA